MTRPWAFATFATLSILALQGCSKPDPAALDASVQEYWRECTVVKPGPVTVQKTKGDIVRFTYVAKLEKAGASVQPSECPEKNRTMLQAISGVDFRKLPGGAFIDVKMERDMKSGATTVVMEGASF